MKRLAVISVPVPTEQERRLLGLAECMGVAAQSIQIPDTDPEIVPLLRELAADSCVLALSARSLARAIYSPSAASAFDSFLENSAAELLIFDWTGGADEQSVLGWIAGTGSSTFAESGAPEVEISFPPAAKDFSRQLAGLSYLRREAAPLVAFEIRGEHDGGIPIVTANGRPIFLRTERGAAKVFLLGGALILGADQPMRREYELRDQYDRILPVLIFLRHVFSDCCWHNPAPSARLILDDPLLTPRYGFLDYADLLRSMRAKHYGTSIAFIPWNAWRTSRRNAARLLKDESLSLCVHGCDHANREFESDDLALLSGKAALALDRMRSLSGRAGVTFEPVMVFPQERYTTSAIAALREQPYLAAVNTICVPTDAAPDDLTVSDFISPAITHYHGFPIFQRRYPRRLFDFACDLFLGKPALLVEHHDYFEAGVGLTEDFVNALQWIEPDLRWPRLDTQLMDCHLRRRAPNGSTDIRFFTRIFRLRTGGEASGHYILSKHEPDAQKIETVLVDGKPTDFDVRHGFLFLELSAAPGSEHTIEIVDHPVQGRASANPGIGKHARVFVRRALSEFRDNILSRHNALNRCAQWAADKLEVTGAGYDDPERYEEHTLDHVKIRIPKPHE